MVDSQSTDHREEPNQYSNYKDVLSEIRRFVTCPDLLKPLDDSEEDVDSDDELAKQLDSQLFNVLAGASGSSICDSESLELSEFSSDEDDDFDKIIEQLHNKTSNDVENGSMPTLSSLFACQQPTVPTDLSPESTKKPNAKKSKLNVKKAKFAQHQTKMNYTFSNESSVRLFDKIIRKNFHQKLKTANSPNQLRTPANDPIDDTNLEPQQECTDKNADSNPVEPTLDQRRTKKAKAKDSLTRNRLSQSNSVNDSNVKEHHHTGRTTKVAKKSKSEIFTLKSKSTNSTLENLLNSIRSK